MTMSPKGLRCFMYVIVLAFWALFAFVLLEKLDRSMTRTVVRRKPAEHFFFDILSGFDPPISLTAYSHMPRTESTTAFLGIMDRYLLSQYLVRRFAYSSFLEIGCPRVSIGELLPESVTIRDCVPHSKAIEFFNSNTSKYGVIILEGQLLTGSYSTSHSHTLSDSSSSSSLSSSQLETLLQKALLYLEEGGTLILTNTNPPLLSLSSHSQEHSHTHLESGGLWSVAVLLHDRIATEVATLDCDGGLTLVKYSTDTATLLSSLPPLSSGTGTGTGAGTAAAGGGEARGSGSGIGSIVSWKDVTTSSERERLLGLMSFEELHNWLAPTGNVDAVTAFGGEKAFESWRDMQTRRKQCSKLLINHSPSLSLSSSASSSLSSSASAKKSDTSLNSPSVSGSQSHNVQNVHKDAALTCFNDLLVSGKANLKARAQLALLLLQDGRLVDAVTLLGELQSLAPVWNRWIWKEISSTVANHLDSSTPHTATWTEKPASHSHSQSLLSAEGANIGGKDRQRESISK